MKEYITLTDDTLGLVQEKTRWPLDELIRLIGKATRMGGRYAVFYANESWHRVFIHHRYDMNWFLNELKTRWKL